MTFTIDSRHPWPGIPGRFIFALDKASPGQSQQRRLELRLRFSGDSRGANNMGR